MGILGKKKILQSKIILIQSLHCVWPKQGRWKRKEMGGREGRGKDRERKKKKNSLSCLIYKYSLLVGPTIKNSLRDKWREI